MLNKRTNNKWLPHIRPPFPIRRSNFISNSKLLNRVNARVIPDTRDSAIVPRESESAGQLSWSPPFPITTYKPARQQQQWWNVVLNSKPSTLSVQTVVPQTSITVHKERSYHKGRFKKRVYGEDSMYIDHDKILYFKHSENKSFVNITVPTGAGGTVPPLTKQNTFIKTSTKSTLHPRGFYIKTPLLKSELASRSGVTSGPCSCRLCSLEKELQMIEKLDREDEIITSISVQLKKTGGNDVWSPCTLSCPPSRPNSTVSIDAKDDDYK